MAAGIGEAMHTIKLTTRQRAALTIILQLAIEEKRQALTTFDRPGDEQNRTAIYADIAESEAILAAVRGELSMD
jgi:hypothetical protein